MKLKLKTLLLACTAAATLGAGTQAHSQAFPEKHVTIMVGFPPGTSTDAVARIIGDQLSRRWGQPVVVDNKPGVGGSLALNSLKNAKNDGYTLALSATAPMNINPKLYGSLNYKGLEDFEPIIQTSWLPYMLVTNNGKNLKSFPEIVEYAKKNPGKLSYASIGQGTTSHLLMEIVKRDLAINIEHIPYKGSSQAQTDVIGGSVDMTFDTVVSTLPHVKSGKLNAIAVSTIKRAELTPEIRTIDEAGIRGFNYGAWLGFFAPKGTDKKVVEKIFLDLQSVLASAEVRKKLENLGSEVVVSKSREEFVEMVNTDNAKWSEVIKTLKIKIE